MSRYASFFDLDDDAHEPECAKWTYVGKVKIGTGKKSGASMWTDDGAYKRTKGNPPCTCGNPAPLIYQGSHIQPHDDDPRGGWLNLAYMPDYCADPEGPVEFLRLSIGQDPRSYHHEHSQGQAELVLDRDQVTRLRDRLTDWLEREDWA